MTTESPAGKTVLLTGGTDGIGKVAATELARRGATVAVTGRDPTKADRAVTEIRSDSGSDAVTGFVADFASQASVRSLATEVRAAYDSLDVLINNAGTWPRERVVTDDGVELTFAVNYLAPFLLTHELLPLLRTGEGGRVVNVSSGLHRTGTIAFDDLHGTDSWDSGDAYRQSKLAIVAFTYELDRRLDGTGVVATCLEPGFVPTTGLFRNLPRYVRVWTRLLERIPLPFVRTRAEAAETYVYLATESAPAVAGKYFEDATPVESAPATYDEDARRRLWETSLELTGTVEYVETEPTADDGQVS